MRVWGQGWRNRENPDLLHFGRGDSFVVLGCAWQAAPIRLTSPFRPEPRGPATSSDAAMIEMYSRSKINLGFSSCGETHQGDERILQVRLRDFEVPMSGGFYMVEHMEELAEFYEIGREIVCYSGPDDLVDKIEYYLAHDAEREAIRKAGYERAHKSHTWQQRFREAFAEMGARTPR